MPSEVAIKTGSQDLLQHAGTQFVPRAPPLAPSRTRPDQEQNPPSTSHLNAFGFLRRSRTRDGYSQKYGVAS